MSQGMRLSVSDVARLLTNPSPENRAETVIKVGAEFAHGGMDDEAISLALEIFRIVVHDAEIRVRKALAESVKDNPLVPHDVAMTLAQDVAEVAIPILENSSVLDEKDLIEIVRNFDSDHQVAIAKREQVSTSISEALANTHNEDVVATLVANNGAKISEQTLTTVLDEFGDNEQINAPLVRRRSLPITIAERLVTLVSESLKEHIVTHHEISEDLASDLILESRERATVSLLGSNDQAGDVARLVDQLFENGRLTPTLVLRALCMGDMQFFAHAMSRRGNIPVANVYSLIDDSGRLGMKSLFENSGMPVGMLDLARVALNIITETEYDGLENDRDRFRSRMIERVLTTFESGINPENLDYFISKLGSSPPPAAAH